MAKSNQAKFDDILDVLDLTEVQWRDNDKRLKRREAYVDGLSIRDHLKKKLGRPKIEKDGNQKFWTFALTTGIKKLGCKQIYVENYKGRSDFLVIQIA